MKRLLLLVVFATTLTLTSCKFDDSDIWDKLDEYVETLKDHEERISALEELCKQMNTNISALQTLVDALEKRDYITNIYPIYKDGEEIGYTISFAYSDTITIYHGKNGADGQDGANGKDGYTPQIGVAQDTDGIYYWTLDGEWLLDANGDKIKAVGTDGKDGQNGQDGANGSNGSNGTNGNDGITPRLKIENDYWYVSYDNGATWQQLGKATGEDGKDGNNGADSIITGVEETETEVIFTLSDNTTITIPKHTKTSLVDPNDICSAMDDVKFMEYCYQNFDVNKDGKVSPVEAKSVRNIDINGLEIYSIKGIEYFEILETLIAENTPLRNVDISFNNKLISFNFENCRSMTSMVLPEGITTITKTAFYGCCKLDSIIIPNSVTWIGNSAFYDCSSLTSVNIPNSVTWIESSAFYDCSSLTSVNIPDSVTTIESSAFRGCSSLTSVTIPNSVTTIKSSTFRGCSSLTSVNIPNSVTTIGDYAFRGCSSLTSVNIPNSVTWIGNSAFYDCSSLTSVNIPNSVTTIGDYAFAYCSSLTSVTIPKSVTSIGDYAFDGCSSLTSVHITDLSAWCKIDFSYYGSNPLHEGAKLYINGNEAADITIPSDITEIKSYAFYNCDSLTSVTIPKSVTTIGEYAFIYCSSLTSVTIGNSVIGIRDYAFYHCYSLTSVTIGNSVTWIGDYAFAYCSSLKDVYCKPITPPTGESSMFIDVASGGKIYVPQESVNAYKTAGGWTNYANAIVGYDF